MTTRNRIRVFSNVYTRSLPMFSLALAFAFVAAGASDAPRDTLRLALMHGVPEKWNVVASTSRL